MTILTFFGIAAVLLTALGVILLATGLVSAIRRMGPVEDPDEDRIRTRGSGLVFLAGILCLLFGVPMLVSYLIVIRG